MPEDKKRYWNKTDFLRTMAAIGRNFGAKIIKSLRTMAAIGRNFGAKIIKNVGLSAWTS